MSELDHPGPVEVGHAGTFALDVRGLVKSYSGSQRARLKSRIGIVLQSTGIDRYLTVRETIAMYATFYPRPRPVDEVIHLVGLEEKSAVRVLKLSGGQQRRLDVAVALVGNPELLFLDEPTTGFD